ncbi:MAG: hypothetical protein AAFP19_21815 [Bacteroidota bacterium]
MLRKNSILLGVILGALIPLVAYTLLLEIYELLATRQIISDVGLSENFRLRTIALLALAFNLIPFILYNSRWTINTMRGVVFPTFIYAVAWMVIYGIKLI